MQFADLLRPTVCIDESIDEPFHYQNVLDNNRRFLTFLPGPPCSPRPPGRPARPLKKEDEKKMHRLVNNGSQKLHRLGDTCRFGYLSRNDVIRKSGNHVTLSLQSVKLLVLTVIQNKGTSCLI